MMWLQCWFMLCFLFEATAVLVCYNCSATHRDWNQCAGDFAPSYVLSFNASRKNLINCTGANAMCFVRSWAARSRHAWLVQRGCYQPVAGDTLPRSMNTPTRAMTCHTERQPDAQYKVCLCQADWCNSASAIVPSVIQFLTKLPHVITDYATVIYKSLMLHVL